MMKKFLPFLAMLIGISIAIPKVIGQAPCVLEAEYTVTDPTCGNNNGVISVLSATGNGHPADTIMPYKARLIQQGPTLYDVPHEFQNLASGVYLLIVTNEVGCSGTAEIELDSSSPHSATIESMIVCGDSTGTLTVIPDSPASYLWDTGDTTVTITGNAGEVYTVEVTWPDGCVLVFGDSLPEFEPAPIFDFSPNMCGDTIGTIALISGSGQTYWSGSPNFANHYENAHTDSSYSYHFVGSLGCEYDGVFTTPLPMMTPVVVAEVVTQPACNSLGTVSATVDSVSLFTFWIVNIVTGDTIQMQDSIAVFDVDSLPVGTYEIAACDQCICIGVDTVTLSTPASPYIVFSVMNDTCMSGLGSVEVNIVGGQPPMEFFWLPGGMTTMNIDSLYADTYFLLVTDANGCTTTAGVVVEDDPCPPGMLSDTTVTFCWGDSAVVNGVWYFESGIDTQFVANPLFPLVTDTLVVFAIELPEAEVISDTSYVCGTVMSISETIDTLQYASIDCDSVILKHILITNPISYSVDSVGICSGDTLAWQGMQIVDAGVYMDTTVNQYGCDSLMTLVVSLNQSIQASVEMMTCIGDSIEYNGEFYQAGVYTILLPGMNTCDTTVTLTVSEYPYQIVQIFADTCELGVDPISQVLQDSNGCDYTLITNFVTVLDTVYQTKFSCTIPAGTITSGVIDNPTGCDELLIVTWQAGSSKSVTFNKVGCVGDPITVAGNDVVFQKDTAFVAVSNYVDPDTGCDSTVTEIVSIHTNPQFEVWTDQPDCNNDGALSVSPEVNGYFYDWTPGGETTPQISGLDPGVYTVNVTDPNGCDDEKSVTIIPYAPIQIDTILDHPLCDGSHLGSIQLSVSGGSGNLGIVWSDGGDTSLYRNDLPAGKYSVNVFDKDTKGCYQTMTIDLGAKGCRVWQYVQFSKEVQFEINLCHWNENVPYALDLISFGGIFVDELTSGTAIGGKLPETTISLPAGISAGKYYVLLRTHPGTIKESKYAILIIIVN